MGALEVSDGINATGKSIISLGVTQSASKLVQVSWPPFSNDTAGYIVYYGTSAKTANVLVSDVSILSVTYDSLRDLGLYTGDAVCFRIDAYNSARTIIGQVSLECRAI